MPEIKKETRVDAVAKPADAINLHSTFHGLHTGHELVLKEAFSDVKDDGVVFLNIKDIPLTQKKTRPEMITSWETRASDAIMKTAQEGIDAGENLVKTDNIFIVMPVSMRKRYEAARKEPGKPLRMGEEQPSGPLLMKEEREAERPAADYFLRIIGDNAKDRVVFEDEDYGTKFEDFMRESGKKLVISAVTESGVEKSGDYVDLAKKELDIRTFKSKFRDLLIDKFGEGPAKKIMRDFEHDYERPGEEKAGLEKFKSEIISSARWKQGSEQAMGILREEGKTIQGLVPEAKDVLFSVLAQGIGPRFLAAGMRSEAGERKAPTEELSAWEKQIIAERMGLPVSELPENVPFELPMSSTLKRTAIASFKEQIAYRARREADLRASEALAATELSGKEERPFRPVESIEAYNIHKQARLEALIHKQARLKAFGEEIRDMTAAREARLETPFPFIKLTKKPTK